MFLKNKKFIKILVFSKWLHNNHCVSRYWIHESQSHGYKQHIIFTTLSHHSIFFGQISIVINSPKLEINICFRSRIIFIIKSLINLDVKVEFEILILMKIWFKLKKNLNKKRKKIKVEFAYPVCNWSILSSDWQILGR